MMQQTLSRSLENVTSGLDPAATNLAAILAKTAVVLIGGVALMVLAAFFDARVATAVADLPPAWMRAARPVSDFGLSGYMFALAALVLIACLVARRALGKSRLDLALTLLAERAVYILAVLAVSGILAQLVKHLVGRARPKLMPIFGPYHFDLLSVKASLASFPSGHAATAFSMVVALGFFFPRWRVPLLILAGVIGISRILLEAHYVSDVVAGGALGVVSTFLVTRFFADWGMSFERVGRVVHLKGRGVVAETFSGRSVS
jgi:membrane-associated phospholipid phosphatase